MTAPKCHRCRDVGWVCKAHPNKAITGPRSGRCGAGMPCPQCCGDDAWNAEPDWPPDVSKLFTSVTHVAGKAVN